MAFESLGVFSGICSFVLSTGGCSCDVPAGGGFPASLLTSDCGEGGTAGPVAPTLPRSPTGWSWLLGESGPVAVPGCSTGVFTSDPAGAASPPPAPAGG